MLKKMMLLAMALGALVAFAVPAAASASTWDTFEEPVGESTAEGDEVHFSGTLSSTKSGLKISCDATANTVLWNDPEQGAVGEATLSLLNHHEETVGCTVAVNVGGGTYADINGCHVTPSSSGENWTITTSGDTVAIEGANFVNQFSGCTSIGIPDGAKAEASGTATGTVTTKAGFEGRECIVFNESGDMEDASHVAVLIDGYLCPTEPGLELTP